MYSECNCQKRLTLGEEIYGFAIEIKQFRGEFLLFPLGGNSDNTPKTHKIRWKSLKYNTFVHFMYTSFSTTLLTLS